LAIASFLGITASVAHAMPGEHAFVAAGLLAFLGHVLADLTAGRTERVLAGFERTDNHDLEFAFAAAYRKAFEALKVECAQTEGFEDWFDRWARNLTDANEIVSSWRPDRTHGGGRFVGGYPGAGGAVGRPAAWGMAVG
jgi:hypothetical protein